MDKRRVVITGMGAVTPLGLTLEESWAAVKADTCGIGPITQYDTTNQKVAQILKSQLAEVGIDITIEPMESGAYNNAVYSNGDYQMTIGSWSAMFLDAYSVMYSQFHKDCYGGTGNITHVTTDELSNLLDAAAQAFCHIRARIDAERDDRRDLERKPADSQNAESQNKQLQRDRRAADDGDVQIADDLKKLELFILFRRDLDDGDDDAEGKPQYRRPARDDHRRIKAF